MSTEFGKRHTEVVPPVKKKVAEVPVVPTASSVPLEPVKVGPSAKVATSESIQPMP